VRYHNGCFMGKAAFQVCVCLSACVCSCMSLGSRERQKDGERECMRVFIDVFERVLFVHACVARECVRACVRICTCICMCVSVCV